MPDGSNCTRCDKPFKGYGDVCSNCRKLKGRGSVQGCVSCGNFFSGFADVCEDCKAMGVAGGAKGKKWDVDGNPLGRLGSGHMIAFRSDEDMALRKTAASSEKAWEGSGEMPGVWVWRIERFQVVPWPPEKYGKFHEGDSYIILQTEYQIDPETGKHSELLEYDVHFWLGKSTSTDEKGVAAYKTVELDNYFDDRAIQHREVQGSESPAFLSYFPAGIEYLPGGVESGFRIVQNDIFSAKLTQVRRDNKAIIFEEEQVERKSLNHRDAFILEKGSHIYVWCGDDASPFVKNAANQRAEALEHASNSKRIVTHEIDEEFWDAMGGQGDITPSGAVGEEVPADFGEGVLYSIQVDDETRKLSVEEIARGDLQRSQLDSTGVMMVDTRTEVFLWLGRESSRAEKASAFSTATNYLKMQGRDVDKTSITVLKEGSDQKSKQWSAMFPYE